MAYMAQKTRKTDQGIPRDCTKRCSKSRIEALVLLSLSFSWSLGIENHPQNHWLVVEPYPSEKYTSQLGWSFWRKNKTCSKRNMGKHVKQQDIRDILLQSSLEKYDQAYGHTDIPCWETSQQIRDSDLLSDDLAAETLQIFAALTWHRQFLHVPGRWPTDSNLPHDFWENQPMVCLFQSCSVSSYGEVVWKTYSYTFPL